MTVTYQGNPIENAVVSLSMAGIQPQLTSSDGTTRFISLPGGNYIMEANKSIDGDIKLGENTVLIRDSILNSINIPLEDFEPVVPTHTPDHRLVTIEGTMFIIDHDTASSLE